MYAIQIPRNLLTLTPSSSLLELLDHLARLALAHLLRDWIFNVVLPSENVDETFLLVRRRVVA